MNLISYENFTNVIINTGTIIQAEENKKTRVPSYVLTIDFGELGIKKSSAQITENYSIQELIGKQIVAVMNFPAKRVAGVKSEVLVLASICAEAGTVLLSPTLCVANGAAVS